MSDPKKPAAPDPEFERLAGDLITAALADYDPGPGWVNPPGFAAARAALVVYVNALRRSLAEAREERDRWQLAHLQVASQAGDYARRAEAAESALAAERERARGLRALLERFDNAIVLWARHAEDPDEWHEIQGLRKEVDTALAPPAEDACTGIAAAVEQTNEMIHAASDLIDKSARKDGVTFIGRDETLGVCDSPNTGKTPHVRRTTCTNWRPLACDAEDATPLSQGEPERMTIEDMQAALGERAAARIVSPEPDPTAMEEFTVLRSAARRLHAVETLHADDARAVIASRVELSSAAFRYVAAATREARPGVSAGASGTPATKKEESDGR